MRCGFISFFFCAKRHILRFFRAVIDRQTWSDGGSVSERRLRSKLLSLACHLEDPRCLERARAIFADWLQSNGTLKYVLLNDDIMHTNSSCVRTYYFMFHCTSDLHLRLFTLACQPMWQRRCFQLELKMTVAGRHCYTHTASHSPQRKKAKSCLP